MLAMAVEALTDSLLPADRTTPFFQRKQRNSVIS